MLPSDVIGLMLTGDLYQTAVRSLINTVDLKQNKTKKLQSAPMCNIADIMDQDQTSQMNMESESA